MCLPPAFGSNILERVKEKARKFLRAWRVETAVYGIWGAVWDL